MMSLTSLMLTAIIGAAPNAPQDAPVYAHLAPLERFVGKWEAKATIPESATPSKELGDIAGKEVVLTFDVEWAPGKCAQVINVDYNITGVRQILGTAIRGWDPESNKICERQFTTHKGSWTGVWTIDGNNWVYEYKGVNLDGKKCAGKRIFTFKDNNHYRVKDVDQTADDVPQPNNEWEFHRK